MGLCRKVQAHFFAQQGLWRQVEGSGAMKTQREMPIFSGFPAPRDASDKTLRMCDTEQDAIAVSIAMSTLTQVEIGKRIGVSEQTVSAWKLGERVMTSKHVGMFCAATGSNLVRQFRTLQSLVRIAAGSPRAADRIAAIASHTQAWPQVERRVA